MGRNLRFLYWALLLVLLFTFLNNFLGGADAPQIRYTTFRQQLREGNVSEVMVRGERIEGVFREPVEQAINDQQVGIEEFVTFLPSFGDEQLLSLLEEHEVEVTTQPEPDGAWPGVLISLLPFLLLIGFGYLMVRRMQSQGQGLFNMGRSKAKLYEREDKHKTTFADVAGTEGAKEELRETIEFLRDPKAFSRLGGKIPKGLLLVGPPGTGKTLLARAVAGEADVPFFNTSGSDFMEMFVGVGASRVRDMFKEARKASPCIIFIDELDSIGRRRGAGLGGGHDEREQTLNQLLSEMDGFEPNEQVIIIAATNRPDILDPALLRPGRFDRQVTVDLPNKQGRLEILKIHARNKPLGDDVDLENVARSTPSFSGTDLENLLNEAALIAARRDREVIAQGDIETARDKVLLGRKRQGISLTEEDARLIAYHEAGHAALAATLPHADPLQKVTIVPRGRAMGVTQQLPERERYIYHQDYLLDRLAVMMGGRAAEEVFLETATSGAAGDFKEATQLARKMVLELGMGKALGPLSYGNGQQQVFLGEELARGKDYSEATAKAIDEEVKCIAEDAFRRAKEVLKRHKEGIERLVETLLEEEEIPGEQVFELLGVEDKALAGARR